LRSQNGVFCEIFRVNQIFLNAFAEKRYFKEVPKRGFLTILF
jgi:hypothetical protein